MPANTRETLMWPGIAFFSFGTLIGQIYYKDKISPFVTEKYSNAMQKNPFTRLLMWCGKNSLLSFVLQILFFLALEVIMAAVNFIS
jgi:Na+/alanine symporter